MRRRCQWLAMVLVLAGCGGAPDRSPARIGSGDPPPDSGSAPSAIERAGGGLRAEDARAFLAAHPEALVLDVRNPDEWNDDLGHIEGARQIPLPELESRVGEIAEWKEKPVVVVCRVGVRSAIAAERLRAAGYAQALNLEGGMEAWRRSAPR